MLISRIFEFDAAHKLEGYEGDCSRLHGHTYKLIVTCSGEVDASGMIIDFKKIKEIIKEKILSKLDHSYINDTIKNPTCENILLWIKQELSNASELKLKKLRLYETSNCFCELEY
jgi:6-pyruvoyltetrahydropterin/6-carboxytetrahydropterin synthase